MTEQEKVEFLSEKVKELNKINPSNEKLEDLRLRLVIKSYNHILFRVATPIELYLPNDFAKLVLDFDENNLYGVPFDVVPDGDDDYDGLDAYWGDDIPSTLTREVFEKYKKYVHIWDDFRLKEEGDLGYYSLEAVEVVYVDENGIKHEVNWED